MRITAQLVDTTSMTNLWSHSYERDVVDVLTIQSEVAQQIASALALALAPDGRRRGHVAVVRSARAVHARPLLPRAGDRARRADGDRLLREGDRR